ANVSPLHRARFAQLDPVEPAPAGLRPMRDWIAAHTRAGGATGGTPALNGTSRSSHAATESFQRRSSAMSVATRARTRAESVPSTYSAATASARSGVYFIAIGRFSGELPRCRD